MNINDLHKAASILRQGGLVAMPTETVYGLAADARNPAALQKIFEVKQRPTHHPLIVHLATVAQLTDWAQDIPSAALALAETFWPGPLTLILKKMPYVDDLITGGQATVGIRIPQHPVAHALLKEFGSGLAAPSANRFGRISPTSAEAVYEELGHAVDFILEGGVCAVGLESTIVDLSRGVPTILRPGMITAVQIEAVLHQSVATTPSSHAPRVSGSLDAHYAPQTQTVLMSAEQLHSFLSSMTDKQAPVVVMGFNDWRTCCPLPLRMVRMPQVAAMYAHDLYAILRELDKHHYRQIIIETVPDTAEWSAVRDRLQRASF